VLLCSPGLQTLAALQGSAGLNLSGSAGTGSSDISAANLQGLATLANLSVANQCKCMPLLQKEQSVVQRDALCLFRSCESNEHAEPGHPGCHFGRKRGQSSGCFSHW